MLYYYLVRLKLTELTETKKQQYNHFVATAESGSFLQSWDWGDWQRQLGREVVRLWIFQDQQETTAAASIQLVKMPLVWGQYYLYAAYGPVVGVQDSEFNMRHFLESLKNKFPDAVFIRVEPKAMFTDLPFLAQKTLNIQPGHSLLIDLTQTEVELLQRMHPKTRYNIRLARRHQVQIQCEFGITVGHGLYFQEALALIVQTAKRQKFSNQGVDYYQRLIDFFALRHQDSAVKLHLYKALYRNRLAACAIMVDFGKTRTYLFGGSSPEYKNVMAPYLLHFQAMIDAKAQGLELYDFWGVETASGKTPGFVRFKQGFGGRVTTYSGAYDYVSSSRWYGVYKFIRPVNRAWRLLK